MKTLTVFLLCSLAFPLVLTAQERGRGANLLAMTGKTDVPALTTETDVPVLTTEKDVTASTTQTEEAAAIAKTDVLALTKEAEFHFLNGEENVAARLYEQVLAIDKSNLQAVIFLANYYYLFAEREKANVESEYHKIRKPNRKQREHYRDRVSLVISTEYEKAKSYLQRVLQLYPSTGAELTIKKIGALEANFR
jgi:tetratricopeptide (TPR) repeat protein